MEDIRWLSLKNNAGFVVKIRIHGSGDYEAGGFFPIEQEKTVDLADAVGKIKDGDVVWLEAVVKGGYNNKAKQRFVYRKSSNNRACYSIKGATLTNTLSYNGIVAQYTQIAQPIRGIKLRNNGAFVARIRVWKNSSSYNLDQDICLKQDQTIDFSETYGAIRDGDTVWLEVVVRGGSNNAASQRFVYRKSSPYRAVYTISGALYTNSLSYNGIEQYCSIKSEPIRFIALKNNGGFVARIRVHGGSGAYNVSSDILVCQEKRVDLADANGIIKDGDEVWLETVVRGGANNKAIERYTYRRTSDNKACYSISGATQTNTLSYNGTYKVGVKPSTMATYDNVKNKIDNWDQKRTSCAWPGILKKEIVGGLKKIADYYFNMTTQYLKYQWLGKENTFYYSGIPQGKRFQTCGPVAVMFSLVKLNISTFVDVVTTLYETGSLMGYNVPSKLRNLESNTNNVEEKYRCYNPYIDGDDPDLANVCWMFHASLAQKESILSIIMDAEWECFDKAERAIRMHTRHDEMEDDVNFVFNAINVKHQGLVTWSSVSKALSNLDEWNRYLNNSGVVLWMMHSTALNNIIDKENKGYNHVELLDLHWVAVTRVQKTASDVTIDLHSWGRLYRITVSHSEFQKMTYLAVLFNVKS